MAPSISFRALLVVPLFLASTTSLGSADPKKGKDKEGGALAPQNPADALEPSRDYVHKWIPTPTFTAVHLPDGRASSVKSVPGRALVVVFLSSWCEPCQGVIDELERIAKRYRRLDTDFAYVFAHDTAEDAAAFMKEYHLESGWLANHEILAAFHNPDLPTIYVGDRRGWLATRFPKADARALVGLDEFLKNATAY